MGLYLSPFQRIIRFIIDTMYMESGFLNLGSTASCAEATFLPATLDFGTKVAGYVASSATPLEGEASTDDLNTEIDTPYAGEVLTTGQQSKALVGTLSTTVTDICSNVYTNVDPIYGNATTHQCKFAQRYVPSSLYSGKLRLFVQAVYGSTRQDYYVAPLTLSTADTYDLNVGGYRLNQGMATSGIFTDSNYNYYMMEVSTDSITFKKLKLTTVAQGWADLLKTHPNKADREFSSKVEAYILSRAIIDPDFTPVVSATGLTISEGGPYAYGFHFNWSGNQAKVVWHRSIGDGTYRARVITLDIADDLTVVGSESGEEAWSNSQYFQFWYPDMFDGVMKTAGTIGAGTINSTGCPMYGFYDYDDTWQQFEVMSSVSTLNPTSDTGPLTSAHLAGNYGRDDIDYERHYVTGSSQSFGSVGYGWKGVVYTGSVSSSITTNDFTAPFIGNTVSHYDGYFSSTQVGPLLRSGQNLHPYLVATYPGVGHAPGWRYISSYGFSAPLGPPYTGTYSYLPVDPNKFSVGVTSLGFNSFERYTGRSDKCEISFSVPFGDCQAVVYGHFSGKSWDSKSTGTGNLSGVLKKPQISLSEVYCSYYNTIAATGNYIEVDIAQTLQTTGMSPSISIASTTGADIQTSAVVYFDSSDITGWTHDANDGYIIFDGVLNTTSPSGAAEKYFRNGNLSGDFHPLMQARASANGAHILYHDEGIGKNENGYPDGVRSAVGWV